MISKISRINNFAVFNNFNWGNSVKHRNGKPLDFNKINILYGQNYSGKTTLSRIFRSLETHQLPEKYDNPEFEIAMDDGTIITQSDISNSNMEVRVFNEDFVRKNLSFLIDSSNKIEPFAILGASPDVLKSIEILELEIGSSEAGKETGLYKQLIDDRFNEDNAKAKYKTAHNSLESKLSEKATNKQTGIKYQSDRYGNQNYNITNIKQDISTILAPNYSTLSVEQKKIYENTLNEQEKNADLFPMFIINIKSYTEQAAELLRRKIGTSNKIQELLLNTALNEWVKEGKKLLNGEDRCAFCGNPITSKRWGEINAHFDEESHLLETEIDSLIERIKNEKNILQKPINIDKTQFYSKFHNNIDSHLKIIKNTIDNYCILLDSIIKQLLEKKSQITSEFIFNPSEYSSEDLIEAVRKINHFVNENNKFSLSLGTAKSEAKKALRLQEVADFCKTIGYEAEEKKVKELQDEQNSLSEKVQRTQALLQAKNQELQEKKRLLNDEEEGARCVNKYLNDYFGHNYVSLQAVEAEEDEKRIKFNIMRGENPAYNLSEGECSLISFCYFMAKLNDIETNGKKPIIWIDDPISSLDSNHVFFVYSLILAEVVKKGVFSQLFLSTHNLDFLKYLQRLNAMEIKTTGKLGSMEKRFFVVNRYGVSSYIEKMPKYLEKNATEYNHLFSNILECSKIQSVNDSNFDTILDFGNTARRFLEIHLYYKFPDLSDDKIHRFFKNDEIAAELINRLCNEGSHGTLEQAQRINELPEAVTAAKKIIDKLQEDSEQFNALIKSIGGSV